MLGVDTVDINHRLAYFAHADNQCPQQIKVHMAHFSLKQVLATHH